MIVLQKFLFLLALGFLFSCVSISEARPLEQGEERTVESTSDEYENLKRTFYSAMKHLSKAAADGDQNTLNEMTGPIRLLANRMGLDQSHCTGHIVLAKTVLAIGPDDNVLHLFRRLYASLFFTIIQNLDRRDDCLAAAFTEASNIGLDTEHLRRIRYLLIFREEEQLRPNFFLELEKLVELTSPSDIERRIAIRKLNMHMNVYSLTFAKALNVSIE